MFEWHVHLLWFFCTCSISLTSWKMWKVMYAMKYEIYIVPKHEEILYKHWMMRIWICYLISDVFMHWGSQFFSKLRKWPAWGSNPRPSRYQHDALTNWANGPGWRRGTPFSFSSFCSLWQLLSRNEMHGTLPHAWLNFELQHYFGNLFSTGWDLQKQVSPCVCFLRMMQCVTKEFPRCFYAYAA